MRSTASIERCAQSADLDQETGYAYYGARYYDNKISTWMSVDNLARKHPYSSPFVFSGNNPLMYEDPDGYDFYLVGSKRQKAFEQLQLRIKKE
ncbi:MAG: hypothetical protein EP346_11845 [Bacteroidetes bacterium]|nr:MAG: hypothetical protein EP346_11845 [Bacteroidota bacterium]